MPKRPHHTGVSPQVDFPTRRRTDTPTNREPLVLALAVLILILSSIALPDAGTASTAAAQTPTSTQPPSLIASPCDVANPTIVGSSASETLTGTPGPDVIFAGDGNDVVNGAAGNDIICAGAGSDVINAGDGDDVVDAGDGNDVVNGNAGNDILLTGTGRNTAYGDDGNDTVVGGELADRLEGGEGGDQITAGAGADVVLGNGGNDTLDGNEGNDSAYGGAGDDVVLGGLGSDTLDGEAGPDRIDGGSGSDAISGGSEWDLLIGGEGSDSLLGGGGGDVVDGGPGSDMLDAGESADVCNDVLGSNSLVNCEVVNTLPTAPPNPPTTTTTTTTTTPPPTSPTGPVIALARGTTGPAGYWYALGLTGFTPGARVTVACHDSVDHNFYTQVLTVDGNGNAGDGTLCWSGDGPDHWVTGAGLESNHVTWGHGAPPPPPAAPPGAGAGASISLARGDAAPLGYWYSGTISGLAPGSQVVVTCHDSVDPGGFHRKTLVVGADGRVSDRNICYSADGPSHWLTAAGMTSNRVDWAGSSSAPAQNGWASPPPVGSPNPPTATTGLPWAGPPFSPHVRLVDADLTPYCFHRAEVKRDVVYRYYFDRVITTGGGVACRFMVWTDGEYDSSRGVGVLPSIYFFIPELIDFNALCNWYAGPGETYQVRNGRYFCTWSKPYFPQQLVSDGRLNYSAAVGSAGW